MKKEVKVPRMGESISEATVSAILKPAGSTVQIDDELLELATDKVNQVLYASQAGVFTPIVKEEEVVKIDQVVGYIDSEGKAEAPEAKELKPKENAIEPSKSDTLSKKQEAKPKTAAAVQSSAGPRVGAKEFLEGLNSSKAASASVSERPQAPEPRAEKEAAAAPQRAPMAPSPGGKGESRSKMSRIRKVIASRLVEVQQTAAMLTTFNEVDMSAIMLLREKYKESFVKQYGVRLGFMSFFVKAVVAGLRHFPNLNSYIDGDEIVHREYYDIGIAVGTDKGLVVPVVRNCDALSFAQVEKSIVDYATKIKEGSLSADDLQGGGFTITNGGTYGSLLSTPILSPRQCGILGMHKIAKRAVVVDNQIVIRDMMYLALSYDHRILDGKEAVSFLVQIKNLLEDPSRMLLNI